VAAALLGVNPWHLQATRWGHEASLVPFLVLLSVASLLWAKLPIADGDRRRPKVLAAGLAGALCGVSCYGYSAVRLFLPCFLLGLAFVCWSALRQALRSRQGRAATVAFVTAFAVFFLPLAWAHWTDPAIGERARILGWIWDADDSLPVATAKVALRYLDHFSPVFLFVRGDLYPVLAPPAGFGLLHWYELPLLVTGVVVMLRRWRVSAAARVLLLWFALYPAGDVLFPHVSSHALRSLAGAGCLALLASCGAVRLGRWSGESGGRLLKMVVVVAFGMFLLASQVLFLRGYFGRDFRRSKSSLRYFGADVLQATEWIRPRAADADAIFITGRAVHPDIVSLVGLRYDPARWFREPRELVRGPLPNGRYKHAYVYLRYGKVHFLHAPSSRDVLAGLAENGRPDRVLLVVRPGELGLSHRGPPVHEILDADGSVRLSVFDLVM
jgi:hypothetical protein